ncbi:MAG: type II toxin-antitoxin system VapC family toxin [Desulfococcaceae bacterium]
MYNNAVTDTHALIWYLEDSPRLGAEAGNFFESCEKGDAVIYIPTICLIEILYLQEKGRIPDYFSKQIESELLSDEGNFILADLTADIVRSVSRIPRSAVPDMPDRIIAGTALYLSLPLISRDRKIQLSQIQTVW